ncbi:alpha/beta hydrolase [Virgisporangium ochraceum]
MHPLIPPRRRRALVAILLALVTAAATGATASVPVSAAPETGSAPVPVLDWKDCDPGLQCATAKVPRDYARPHGPTIDLAVIRWPAKNQATRIGSMFVNPGGPGVSGLEFLKTAPPGALDAFARFDVVSWDPRGIGASRPAVDCLTDEEQNSGGVNVRFPRPADADRAALVRDAKEYVARCVRRNADILPYLATANIARDLGLLRAAVGDRKLTYVGLSHGANIGATYASLFPGRARALLLDAPVDPDVWVNRTFEATREQAAGFEDALRRFLTACALDQTACGFGGANPQDAFDDLVARLNRSPMPAPDSVFKDPVGGDDVLMVALDILYSKRRWAPFAAALAQTRSGNASLMRDLLDASVGRRTDGTWPPSGVFFTTTAQDLRINRDIDAYMDAGRHGFGVSPHFWWFSGYGDIPYAVYPVPQKGAFRGPFTNPSSAQTALVIAGTHDPATPYVWGQRYVAQLGNARLLTYAGDGHGSLTEFNPCVLQAALSYLNDLTLPADGSVCAHTIPTFPASARSAADAPEWRVPRAGAALTVPALTVQRR